jgi:proline racemase
MGEERGMASPFSPELVARVAAELHERLPPERWEERVAWRDEALIELERARRASGSSRASRARTAAGRSGASSRGGSRPPPNRLEPQRRHPPAFLCSAERVPVTPPELAVGRPVDVAMPRVQVGEAARHVAVQLDADVGDMVAGGCEELVEPDGDPGGDLGRAADDRRHLRPVVDGRVLDEERAHRLGLVRVEVLAVGEDQIGDRLPVGQLAHSGPPGREVRRRPRARTLTARAEWPVVFAIDAVDAHAEGQHGRVVVGGEGVLAAPGATMFEKMKHFEERADWFRRLMVREPRGYPRACVNVVLPTTDPRADAGFVIMEQSELYAAMSGTNLMVVATVLLETGQLPMTEPETTLVLEVPAGLVEVRARCEDGRVLLVEFENVPSFATAVDVPIDVPGHGRVPVSVAWAEWRARSWTRPTSASNSSPSRRGQCRRRSPPSAGRRASRSAFATRSTTSSITWRRPSSSGARTTTPTTPSDLRPPGRADGHLAERHGHLGGDGRARPRAASSSVGDSFVTEGLLGGVFRCGVARDTDVGGTTAIVPRIGGRAWITGYARYVLQDDDPFPEGFTMGDIWPSAKRGLGRGAPLRAATGHRGLAG